MEVDYLPSEALTILDEDYNYGKTIWRAYRESGLSRKKLLDGILQYGENWAIRTLLVGHPYKALDVPRSLMPLFGWLEYHGLITGNPPRMRYGLLGFEGIFVFVDLPYVTGLFGTRPRPRHQRLNDEVHFGADTFYMYEVLGDSIMNIAGQPSLDLCCGSGALALALASRGAQVDAIDINERAIGVAHLSACLNGLTLKLSVGDARRMPAAGCYSAIVANTPYVATPTGISCAKYADGGQDGFGVGGPIMMRLRNLLAPGGQARVMTVMPASIEQAAMSITADLNVKINTLRSWSVREYAKERGGRRSEQWIRHFHENNIDGLSLVLLIAERAQ